MDPSHENESRPELAEQMRRLQRSFLTDVRLSDDEVEQAMIDRLKSVLDNPVCEQIPAGRLLLESGQVVQGIRILLAGRIELLLRSGDRDVILHSASAGRIIGLQSLANGGRAFYTCRAVSDLTVISLSLAELDGVLQRDSQLSVHFVTVLIRSLARRVERAAELQVEVEQLNQKLSGERDQLASTLRQLERTQMRLVESEKMATLGQMSAGIAHELNNPVTAIHRTASHLREDIDLLIGQLPDAENVREEIERLFNAAPISTRDERAARKAIAEQIRDDALADRLVRAGLTRIEDVRGRFGTLDTNTIEAAMPNLETHARLAKSLRNLVTCAARITDLVGSLRSYAKPGMEYETDVDLHACIEDTIRLFGHASREVQIERDYGELPLVACRVGELNQVWTNLISNALNAMHHAGTLRVSTRVAGGDHVVVDITDSGPGVAPSNIDRIFDMNFTTRSGPAHFGLGLGLPISKSIVERHGGTLTVTSEPGRTTFTTLLPIERPALLDEESSP